MQAAFASVRSLVFVNTAVEVTELFRRMRFPDDLDSLRQWLDGGGDPADRYDGRSPVELAARKGKLELVQLLVGRGAPVGDAYLEACDAGRGEVAHWLFAQEPGRQAEPDALTFEQPGLWGEPAFVRALLDAGADVNHRAPDGTTPLHRAAQHAPPSAKAANYQITASRQGDNEPCREATGFVGSHSR